MERASWRPLGLEHMAGIAQAVGGYFAAERARWPNWVPVLLGFGIGFYFALPVEPPLWTGPLAAAALLGFLLLVRRRPVAVIAALALFLVGLGYMAAVLRSHEVAAPRIAEELRPRAVSGEVVEVERFSPRYYRMLIARPRVAGLEAATTPARLRITVRTGGTPPLPGDRVDLRAGLFPPAGPASPGSYDFGETAWFSRLGGLGYAVSRPVATPPAKRPLAARIAIWRQSITDRLMAASEGQKGAVSAAVVTGDRSAISAQVTAAFRISGIAHLLAISGLNLGLASGIVFFALRAGLALIPGLALNYPIKKWAAGAALLSGAFYTVLSGMPVPAVRSFLMTGLVLLAVMLDRAAISMRLVVIAATVILLLTPEALLNISFQMSFAAVVALIAFYEVLTAHPGRGEASALPRWLLYVLELLATSLLAGAATDLFGAYQFHRIAVYGLVTNLIAIPVTGFWVMPWAVVAMTLMPFGLERWGAVPMAWGNDVIIRAAEIVAAWPGAQWRFAAYGPGALLLMTAGALWLALWRRPWRYWGLMPLFLGLGLAAMPRPPDILIGTDGKMIALRDAKGQLAFNVARRGIARDDWLERAGETEPRRWREMPAEGERSLSCDEGGCVYHVKGYQVSFPETLRALGEDCRYADFIVAAFPLPRDCRPMLGQIDLFDLRREGPMTVRFSDGAEIETVRRIEGERPWSQWVP